MAQSQPEDMRQPENSPRILEPQDPFTQQDPWNGNRTPQGYRPPPEQPTFTAEMRNALGQMLWSQWRPQEAPAVDTGSSSSQAAGPPFNIWGQGNTRPHTSTVPSLFGPTATELLTGDPIIPPPPVPGPNFPARSRSRQSQTRVHPRVNADDELSSAESGNESASAAPSTTADNFNASSASGPLENLGACNRKLSGRNSYV